VGCQDQILVTNKQAVFAEQMQQLCNLSTNLDHPYSFASKIMYGSDWYMPIEGGDRHDFLARYQQVFLLPPLRRFYTQFFLSNALDYLNATDRTREDTRFPLEREVRLQLKDLLGKAQPLIAAEK
jgi:hypothetical protein